MFNKIRDSLGHVMQEEWNGRATNLLKSEMARAGVDYEERYDFQNPGVAANSFLSSLVRNTARFADAARTIGLPRLTT